MERPDVIRKRQGFKGQKLIVLPKKITTEFLTRDPVTRQIYITDLGYYPKAAFHYVERPTGIGQHIIIYCMEGSGWVVIDRKRIELGPSQFITIPANTAHKYGANQNDPWTIYWFHFKGEIAAFVVDLILQRARTGAMASGSSTPESQRRGAITYDENRIKLFEEIYAYLEKGYGQDNLRYVNMIFYHFLSSLLYEDKFSHADKGAADDIIARTIEQMQRKIHTVVGLKVFADFANLSVSHFSAVFKDKTGYAPVEYFNHLKIQKACQYLLLTPMTVKEIAVELGIDDQYYFSRMFSRLMGYSPVEYRKRNRMKK
jgi:AraC family transcriptional regulator of arabinose operon